MKHDQINPAQEGQAVDRSRQMLHHAHFDTKGERTKPLARQWRLWQVVFTDLHRAHFVI
jgi:hypothetical protein